MTRKFFLKLHFAILFYLIACQTTPRPLLEPTVINDDDEYFQYNDTCYRFRNIPLTFTEANEFCMLEYGDMVSTVIIPDEDVVRYLAEALSETKLIMEQLWTSARRANNHSEFIFRSPQIKNEQNALPLPASIKKFLINRTAFEESLGNNTRDCLAFNRFEHDIPFLVNINCESLRPFICEIPGDCNTIINKPPNDGWIQIEDKVYKIFYDKRSYKSSKKACIQNNPKARLTTIESFKIAQIVGRYMLIGRPSLERAWIGAQKFHDHYEFEYNRSIILANKTGPDGFPPWLRGYPFRFANNESCLLLDRHLANITLFVEERCTKPRAYICFMPVAQKAHYIDYPVIGNHDYRSYLTPTKWEDAHKKCLNLHDSGNLPIVMDEQTLAEILYVMGENRTALRHIWAGGKKGKSTNGSWVWYDVNRTPIPQYQDKFPTWLQPSRFGLDAQEECLNLDRENFNMGLFYGLYCKIRQKFICQFPKGTLPLEVYNNTGG